MLVGGEATIEGARNRAEQKGRTVNDGGERVGQLGPITASLQFHATDATSAGSRSGHAAGESSTLSHPAQPVPLGGLLPPIQLPYVSTI
jgi:hypothetical protein